MGNLLFIVGMMGAGKTSFGQALAMDLKLPFFDTDEWIESQCGMSVQEIFDSKGEVFFREMERNCIQRLENRAMVVATGGGLPCHHNLMDALLSRGLVIYLKVDVEIALQRLHFDDSRPLLQKEKSASQWEKLLFERIPIYEQAPLTLDGNQHISDLLADFSELNKDPFGNQH